MIRDNKMNAVSGEENPGMEAAKRDGWPGSIAMMTSAFLQGELTTLSVTTGVLKLL
jgi:hypothetical protein